jgi:3-carboxy-cis,cis-muconate cycloisomerase
MERMAAGSISQLHSAADVVRIFSLENRLRQMVRFEWALSGALEDAGLAAKGTAAAMEPLLNAEFVDRGALLEEAEKAGNLAIPLVKQLTAAVRERSVDAAYSIHLGATSQDVLDTALVLQAREALSAIVADLEGLTKRLAERAREHASTVLAGRTWMQIAAPTTLGLKIAGWVAALRRHRSRLDAAAERALVLQFGGAVGTLAALGERGADVSAALAKRLELREPELPWHTHRDNLAELAAALAMLVGTLGKMARDVSLLMQTEVGEVLEPSGAGRGGSSTMPHKRNPVACAAILAAATRVPGLVATLLAAMPQEHERGLGNWLAEAEVYPEIFVLASGAVAKAIEIADGMEVHPERMAANLAASRGLPMAEAVSIALAAHVGREKAHSLVEAASHRAIEGNRSLRDVLLGMAEVRERLDEAAIDRLLDPHNYLGSAQRFIDRALGATNASR